MAIKSLCTDHVEQAHHWTSEPVISRKATIDTWVEARGLRLVRFQDQVNQNPRGGELEGYLVTFGIKSYVGTHT